MKEECHIIFMSNDKRVGECNMLVSKILESNVLYCAKECCLSHKASELSAYVIFQNGLVQQYFISFDKTEGDEPLIIKSADNNQLFYDDNIHMDENGKLIIETEPEEETLKILSVRELNKKEKIIFMMIASFILSALFTTLYFITPEGKYSENLSIIDHFIDILKSLEVMGMAGGMATILGSIPLLCAIKKNEEEEKTNHI